MINVHEKKWKSSMHKMFDQVKQSEQWRQILQIYDSKSNSECE